MRLPIKFTFTLLLLFAVQLSFAQELTGIWRGSFTDMIYSRDGEGRRISIPASQYKFEVQIAQTGNRFDAVTYSYLSTIFYGKATARGTVNQKNGKVLLEELKLVEVKMQPNSGACAMTLFMQYSKSGSEEFMEGTFSSMNVADSSRCPGGKVFLRKVPISDFYKEPIVAQREKEIAEEKKKTLIRPKSPDVAKSTPSKPPAGQPKELPKNPPARKDEAGNKAANPDPVLAPSTLQPRKESTEKAEVTINQKEIPALTPKVLLNRDNELVKTIYTDSRTVSIRLYDNGTIDNDTVSVYLDKKLVISRQRLSDKPISLSVTLDDDADYHELVMVAENLGEIPPNTSLMVVNAGDKHYEVHITSTEQKNAVVIFRFQK